jgi:hypothetical protein
LTKPETDHALLRADVAGCRATLADRLIAARRCLEPNDRNPGGATRKRTGRKPSMTAGWGADVYDRLRKMNRFT